MMLIVWSGRGAPLAPRAGWASILTSCLSMVLFNESLKQWRKVYPLSYWFNAKLLQDEALDRKTMSVFEMSGHLRWCDWTSQAKLGSIDLTSKLFLFVCTWLNEELNKRTSRSTQALARWKRALTNETEEAPEKVCVSTLTTTYRPANITHHVE